MKTLTAEATLGLTLRQERFCHRYVLTANAAGAAREAGYESQWAKQQGRRLLRTVRIQKYIRDIHTRLAEDHGRDVDSIIGKLEIVYLRALENHQFYAAARALELQAKLSAQSSNKIGGYKPSHLIEVKTENDLQPRPNQIPVKNASDEQG